MTIVSDIIFTYIYEKSNYNVSHNFFFIEEHAKTEKCKRREEKYKNFHFKEMYCDVKDAIKKSESVSEALNNLIKLASKDQIEQVKTLQLRLVTYITRQSNNGGPLTKDITDKFGDDMGDNLRSALRAVAQLKNKRWVLRGSQSIDEGDLVKEVMSKGKVKKSKVKKCLMLVCAMMR